MTKDMVPLAYLSRQLLWIEAYAHNADLYPFVINTCYLLSSIISFPPCHKQDLCPSLACLLKVIPRATRWRTSLLSTVYFFRLMPRSLTILFCDYATPLTSCPAGTVNILETSTASWLLNRCCPIGLAQVAIGPLPGASQSSGGSWLQLWCWWSLLIFLIGPSITQVLVRMCMMWHHKLRGHLHTAGSWAISVTTESRHTHTNTDCWSFCWSRGNTKLFLRSQRKNAKDNGDFGKGLA